MKRRRTYGRHRLSRDAERLTWLAQGLADSGSRLEDHWWESEMTSLIEKLLKLEDEDALNQALDRLHDPQSQTPSQARAYEELADLIEAGCEAQRNDSSAYLLLAIPVLAWSRFNIPARTIPPDTLDTLRAHLSAHVLAAEAKVVFADFLFSPDQLPQGYSRTWAFAKSMWQAAAQGQDLQLDAATLPESQTFISDVRYLLAAVEVSPGSPVFRWNEPDGRRDAALAAWQDQAGPNLQSLLAGCAYELLLPDAYFAAWRRADQENRTFAIKAAAAYLQAAFNVPAAGIRAIVAPYFDRWLEEWRVGFTLPDSDQVVHGVTWPLLGQEDEGFDVPGHIEAVLRSTGMTDIQILDTRMPLEYCDDCGAPLFPNPDGENVHTELPDNMQEAPAHLH